MMELIAANWWAFVLALAVGIAAAWWLFAGNRKAQVELKNFDPLDEGAGPARRNQALIDAPVKAEPEPAAARASVPRGEDDLTRIKGLGPKLAALLNSLGVTSFFQIASWSEEDIDRIDAQLGTFQGRIRRDNWVEQARLLAQGDMAGFEDRFGKL